MMEDGRDKQPEARHASKACTHACSTCLSDCLSDCSVGLVSPQSLHFFTCRAAFSSASTGGGAHRLACPVTPALAQVPTIVLLPSRIGLALVCASSC